ncbi:hypothetical protein [Spirosoma pomorum]
MKCSNPPYVLLARTPVVFLMASPRSSTPRCSIVRPDTELVVTGISRMGTASLLIVVNAGVRADVTVTSESSLVRLLS